MRADEPLKTGQKRDTLLYICTDPPGAKVFLNGKEVGVSNGLFHVEPGSGSILVELEGRTPVKRPLIIRANAVTRLVLELKPQAEAAVEAKGAHPSGRRQPATVKPVPNTVSIKSFRGGDSITITEVQAASPDLKSGDKVIVRGHYILASQPKASLCLFATAVEGPGIGESNPNRESASRPDGENSSFPKRSIAKAIFTSPFTRSPTAKALADCILEPPSRWKKSSPGM